MLDRPARGSGSRPARNLLITTLSGLGGLALLSCSSTGTGQLHCDDLLPPSSEHAIELERLSLRDEEKGCVTNGECHAKDVQRGHLRIDTPELLFEEYRTQPELNYALLVSGRMPDHGTQWNARELQIFRSWYCNGAFSP